MDTPSRLRWWRGHVSNWLHKDMPLPRSTPDGATLADELAAAATELEERRAIASSPASSVELETTEEERADWLSMLPGWPDNQPAISKAGAMRLLRDFDRLSATIAQREGEIAKLREALDARVATVIGAVSYLNIGLTSDQRRAVAASIRTVLASSSLAEEPK